MGSCKCALRLDDVHDTLAAPDQRDKEPRVGWGWYLVMVFEAVVVLEASALLSSV